MPPSQIVSGVPAGLEGITLQLLAKNPADGYATCNEPDRRSAPSAVGQAAARPHHDAIARGNHGGHHGRGRGDPSRRRPAADPAHVPADPAETAVHAELKPSRRPSTRRSTTDPGARFGRWILLGVVLGALGVLWYLLASGRLDNEGTSVSIDMPSVIDLPSAEAITLLQERASK